MKKTGILILVVLALFCALYLGGFLVGIAVWLFKIMIGLIAIGLLTLGYYIGRWTTKK